MDIVAQAVEPTDDGTPIIVKLFGKKASHILNHHSLGGYFLHQTQHLREQVALVIGTHLFSCHTEGRTWHATGQQVNISPIWAAVKLPYIHAHYIPLWPVIPQAVAIVLLILHQQLMGKPSHFQSQRLPARSCTNFQ